MQVGALDLREYERRQRTEGKGLKLPMSPAALIKILDSSHDHLVSFEEFLAIYYPLASEHELKKYYR
jgi:hypothetical protein